MHTEIHRPTRYNLFQDVKASCRGTFFGAVDDLCQEKIDRVRWVMRLRTGATEQNTLSRQHRRLMGWAIGCLQELKDLNKYNILAPCYHHPEIQEVEFSNSSLPRSFRRLGETDRPFPVRKRMSGRSWPLRLALKDGHVPMWPGLSGRSLPCTVCCCWWWCACTFFSTAFYLAFPCLHDCM